MDVYYFNKRTRDYGEGDLWDIVEEYVDEDYLCELLKEIYPETYNFPIVGTRVIGEVVWKMLTPVDIDCLRDDEIDYLVRDLEDTIESFEQADFEELVLRDKPFEENC